MKENKKQDSHGMTEPLEREKGRAFQKTPLFPPKLQTAGEDNALRVTLNPFLL